MLRIFLVGFVIWASSPASLGAETSHTSANLADPLTFAETELQPPFHQRNFFYLGYARNFPVSFSSPTFDPGVPHPILGYRYFMSGHWSMGVSAQMKMLSFHEEAADLAIISFAQDSYYNLRLYHPLYLMFGAKFLYLLPARRGMLPVQKHPDFDNEVGAALSVGLYYFLSPDTFLELHCDRWRGTKTMKLHAVETAFSVGHAL